MKNIKCCRCDKEAPCLTYIGLRDIGWSIYLGSSSIYLCPECRKEKKLEVKIKNV